MTPRWHWCRELRPLNRKYQGGQTEGDSNCGWGAMRKLCVEKQCTSPEPMIASECKAGWVRVLSEHSKMGRKSGPALLKDLEGLMLRMPVAPLAFFSIPWTLWGCSCLNAVTHYVYFASNVLSLVLKIARSFWSLRTWVSYHYKPIPNHENGDKWVMNLPCSSFIG